MMSLWPSDSAVLKGNCHRERPARHAACGMRGGGEGAGGGGRKDHDSFRNKLFTVPAGVEFKSSVRIQSRSEFNYYPPTLSSSLSIEQGKSGLLQLHTHMKVVVLCTT